MKNTSYFSPQLGLDAFHCPYCNVYAKQFYGHLRSTSDYSWGSKVDGQSKINKLLSSKWTVTVCQRCGGEAIWVQDELVYPQALRVNPPNKDLPEEIKADYLEAASVLVDSPRAAAALLRLALQKLCKELGENGENINNDIKCLVEKGLNPLVQKSLDALRITGNNAVHPGEINLVEEPERVVKLFDLINFVASKMITEPSEINAFYDDLPSSSIDAVQQRDKK